MSPGRRDPVDHGLGPADVDVVHGHLGAGGGEHCRDPRPHALAGAGHEGSQPVKVDLEPHDLSPNAGGL